jgi:hypothetical protein
MVQKWRVLINTDKSKCIHFRKGRQPPTAFRYHIGNNNLDLVKEYKYLGVIFDEKLYFNSHCDTLGKAASRALGGLNNTIHEMSDWF